jgi:hypothetical protein
MNTAVKFLALFLLGCSAVSLQAGRGEIDYAAAVPSAKAPLAVSLHRNPFRGASEPEKPLPVLRDKDDPVTLLPIVLNGHVRSVFRRPRSLLLLDDAVFQPGDEIRLAREQPLPKHRVLLKRIEADRLVFAVSSLDPQHPGQVDACVLLTGNMRQN